MPSLLFVVGHDDTPEAYWRILLVARALGAPALFVEDPRMDAALEAAQVVWLYQPTGYAAAELAERANARGKRVIVDLAEDPFERSDYNSHRREACRRAMNAAGLLVVATPELQERYPHAQIARTPMLFEQEEAALLEPPTLLWWTDGRQKAGWEEVAETVGQLLEDRELRLRHVQLPHLRPLTEGLPEDRARLRAQRCHVFLSDGATPDEQASSLLRGARGCYLHLETYSGAYGRMVSDLPLLRAAALGIPSLCLRPQAPPGCITAPPHRWRHHLEQILDEPGLRRALASEARAWARSRAALSDYHAILGGD